MWRLMCWHAGQRVTGSPRNSLSEFRRRFPSAGHVMSKRLINSLSKGFTVTENKAFSMAAICIAFTLSYVFHGHAAYNFSQALHSFIRLYRFMKHFKQAKELIY